MKHLVLVGGGHSHALVLRGLIDAREPDLAVTLVAPDRASPYSGMLPGHIAGTYTRDEMHIDLVGLARRLGARFVRDSAVGFDAAGRRVHLAGGESLGYDLLSIDIGVTPDLDKIAGAERHAVAVKPIGDLLDKIEDLVSAAKRPDGPRSIAVVGGGAAGVCLAFALRTRLARETGEERGITLVTRDALLPEVNALARRFAARSLKRRRIALRTQAPVEEVTAQGLVLADGERLPADAVLVASTAKPPDPLAHGDLSRDERGFLAIDEHLRVLGREDVFASGDCATMLAHPRPKAGVFAVRQGGPLLANLRAAARGTPLEAHHPQRDWLMLIASADGRAVASRGSLLAWEGRIAWMLKDRIDRAFMRQFAE